MAQKTRTQLITQSNSTFQDAPPANITPPNHRQFNDDAIDSIANLEDNNTFNGINTFNEAVLINHRLDTAFVSISTANSTNVATAAGNFILLTGSNTISQFGNAPEGSWRLIKFNNNTILQNGVNILIPFGQNLDVKAGDTCIIVSVATNVWSVFSYTKFNGDSIAPAICWKLSNSVPTAAENAASGYPIGYRWIYVDPTSTLKREYCLHDINGRWVNMGGVMGDNNNISGDINVDQVLYNFNVSGTPTFEWDLRYTIVSDVMLINGYFLLTNVNLNSAHPNGTFTIDASTNDAFILFGAGNIGEAKGLGIATWNGAGAPHKYHVGIQSAGGLIDINIATDNPHFGSNGTIIVRFQLSIGIALTP